MSSLCSLIVVVVSVIFPLRRSISFSANSRESFKPCNTLISFFSDSISLQAARSSYSFAFAFAKILFRILRSFGVFISAKCCDSFNKLNTYFLGQPLFSYMDFLHTETVLSSLTHPLIPQLHPEKSLSSCLSRQITQLRNWTIKIAALQKKRYWEQEESQIHGQRVFLFKTTPLIDIN